MWYSSKGGSLMGSLTLAVKYPKNRTPVQRFKYKRSILYCAMANRESCTNFGRENVDHHVASSVHVYTSLLRAFFFFFFFFFWPGLFFASYTRPIHSRYWWVFKFHYLSPAEQRFSTGYCSALILEVNVRKCYERGKNVLFILFLKYFISIRVII